MKDHVTLVYGCGHKLERIHVKNGAAKGARVICTTCGKQTHVARVDDLTVKQYMMMPNTNFKWREHIELWHNFDSSTHTVFECKEKHRMLHLMDNDWEHTHERPTRQDNGGDDETSS